MGKGQNSPRSVQPLLGGRAPRRAGRAIAATRNLGRLADALLVEHRRCLGCSLHRCPSCVVARAVGSIRGDQCGHLGDVVLLVVVGLFKSALDGDDPLGARHLQLQIGVIGDNHELGEAWLALEGMVDAREVDHLEGERLLAEVVRLAKGDAKPDALEGHRFLP